MKAARTLRLIACAALLFSFSAQAAAPMGMDALSRSVWKRVFAVAESQLTDPDWLARDDDGDGISNGAEIAAGTDPFSAGSVLALKQISLDSAGVQLVFATVKGKQYVVQKKVGLNAEAVWEDVSPAVILMGNDADRTVTVEYSEDTLYRVLVQDVDTDHDGLSDWAEIRLGLDPNKAQSNNTRNPIGKFFNDGEYASANLLAENVVSVKVDPERSATEQPGPGISTSSTAAFVITREGLPEFLRATPIDVVIGGTAVAGTDYRAITTPIVLPAGTRSVTVQVVPLANAARITPGTVTMTIADGAGYRLGANAHAAVQLLPSSVPHGTGLTGTYYSSFHLKYNNSANFLEPSLGIRVDPAIDFKWSTAATLADGLTRPLGTATALVGYSIRWTGQIQPQYSEKYYFMVSSDDGAVLKINQTTVINSVDAAANPGIGQVLVGDANWGRKAALTTVTTAPIELKAGVRYNIELDYFSENALGETRLYWYSPNQPKQVVPTSRLYPTMASDTAEPPVLTSEPVIYGYLGQPLSALLTASNSPTSFTVQSGNLPAGLDLSTTGALTGTPTVAGESYVTVRIGAGALSSDAAVKIVILDTGGGLTREVWKNLSADNALASIPTTLAPDISDAITQLDDQDKSLGDNYGERLRGYLTVKTTGNYYFWLAANDSAELWLANDDEPASRTKRATVSNGGAVPYRWDQQTKQKSGWLNLKAGRKYYIEVLHKGRSGADHHLTVGWMLDPTGNGTPLANGTGVVPAHVLWGYYPATSTETPAATTLYYAKMRPQGISSSNASGLATLRLSEDKTKAVLNFAFGNLSSEVIGRDLHAESYQGKDAGLIIYDIDTGRREADGSYTWTIGPVGPYSAADMQQIIATGKCYIGIHTVNFPNGELTGYFSLARGAQTFTPPASAAPIANDPPTVAQASRFLAQATFGATPTDLAAVTGNGYRAWLTDQLALPAYKLSPLVKIEPTTSSLWLGQTVMNAWWQRSVMAPDQLRQRMAFALSQVLVVSQIGRLEVLGNGLSSYYDLLLDGAFGNFRDLLKNVTLHPAMGLYLDMRANRKSDITTGRHSNENYAREVMQLFSIGLNRLWPDGTAVLDSEYRLVPTYDQEVIEGLAEVFTGWTYNQPRQSNNRLPISLDPTPDLLNPMMLVPRSHSLADKRSLNNEILPAPPAAYQVETTSLMDPVYTTENAYDAVGLRDLEAVIDALFNHPNVGPFLCRQLIQRLVTSHPSPGYVYRVVQAFNGERDVDGVATGVRGDLQATLLAILLDPEARAPLPAGETIFGKQREPLLRVTAPARYLAPPLTSGTGTYTETPASPLGRLSISLPPEAALPLRVGDAVNLQFDPANAVGTSPLSSCVTVPTYTVKTVGSSNGGAVQDITVDAFGQGRGTFTQAGTTAIISFSLHQLKVNGGVYLKFPATANVAAEEGIYLVTTLPSGNTFTVTRTNSGTVTTATEVLLNRVPNSKLAVASGVLTITTPIAHRLSVGDKVTVNANGRLDGGYVSTVLTVIDSLSFTVTGYSGVEAALTNIYVFPMVPLELSRSGHLKVSASTWNLNFTDGDSGTASIGQSPLRSPTVFNFFLPDFKVPGAMAEKGYTTPEFQLTSESNTMLLSNFLTLGFASGTGLTGDLTDGRTSFREGSEAIMMDLAPLLPYAPDAIPALVTKLNDEMMGGTMSAGMQQALVDYLKPANFSNAATRTRDMVRAAVSLILTSPEYAIQK